MEKQKPLGTESTLSMVMHKSALGDLPRKATSDQSHWGLPLPSSVSPTIQPMPSAPQPNSALGIQGGKYSSPGLKDLVDSRRHTGQQAIGEQRRGPGRHRDEKQQECSA